MKITSIRLNCALALMVGGLLVAVPAMADKHDKGGRDDRSDNRGERHDQDNRSSERRHYFDDKHRVVVHEYYEEHYRGGHCPPGLARKNNGCLPPGQARRWEYGRPLPRDVVYYEVPRDVVTRIGPPPSGYRYVRVAADILMIAAGTGLVVDAIEDISR